jgi:exopolyphosphatase/pppGpp-phosphohydrolase
LLRDPEASLQRVIDACVEEEHYIPIYNLEQSDDRSEGQLLFTYQEYESLLAERKPFVDGAAFIQEESYLEPYDKAQTSGMHRFTLKEHLLLATRLAAESGESYGLNPEERTILEIAARLHDIGKDATGEQVVDNPVQAEAYLSQIRGLTADEKELILSLVRYDELLGDILQGKKKPDMFARIFPGDRQQLMLLALYKADVKAIDGDEDEQSAYRQWQVDEKLKELGLERKS